MLSLMSAGKSIGFELSIFPISFLAWIGYTAVVRIQDSALWVDGSRANASHCRFWPKGCLAVESKLEGHFDVPRLYLDYKVAERKSLIQQVLA